MRFEGQERNFELDLKGNVRMDGRDSTSSVHSSTRGQSQLPIDIYIHVYCTYMYCIVCMYVHTRMDSIEALGRESAFAFFSIHFHLGSLMK